MADQSTSIGVRFTVRSLLAFTALIAFGCAAIAYPRGWVPSIVVSVTFFALLAAVLAAIVCRGTLRAFSVGFALFGWSYLILDRCPLPIREFYNFLLFPNQLYGLVRDWLPDDASNYARGEIWGYLAVTFIALCGGFLGRLLYERGLDSRIDVK